MKETTCILVFSALGFLSSLANAADISGQWHAEFDSPRGKQKIQFEFKAEGNKLTGKTVSQIGGNLREADIQEGKMNSNAISFSQVMDFPGQ